MKKITFFISSLGGGGAEGVCVSIANGLAAKGWDITILTMNLNDTENLQLVTNEIKIRTLDTSNARFSLFSLISQFKKEKIGLLCVFNYELIVLSLIARYFTNEKFKIIARNINTISEISKFDSSVWRRFIIYPLVKLALLKVDGIVNQCQGMKDDLISILPRVSRKCVVIYNAVNAVIEKSGNTTKNKQEINNISYILCVGRLEHQKSFHFAIDAFAELRREHPNLRLKIVGKGSLEDSLKNQAKNLGLENVIDFEGFSFELSEYYALAEFTLLTSRFEGFPNVLIESITMGTPVVSFDCKNGPNEIILSGINGELAKHQNINDLVKKMNLVLKNKDKYSKAKESSYTYSSLNIINKWEKFFSNYN